MLHRLTKTHRGAAALVGLTLSMCGIVQCAEPVLLTPAPDIREQTESMKQERPSRWWNRRRKVRTEDNPPLLSDSTISEPYTMTPEEKRADPTPEIRVDTWAPELATPVVTDHTAAAPAAAPAPEPAPPPVSASVPAPVRTERYPIAEIPSYAVPMEPAPEAYDAGDTYQETMVPPAPEGVEKYRVKLEDRLLERYNNLPEYAGQVAQVRVVLSKALDVSMDGTLIRAEFDQLVYDRWGKRMPDLEKEYYVVTFGAGGVRQVRSDPSIRIGLDMEKTYSEKAPLVADPFRNVETQEAFRPAPRVKMPHWWRPDVSAYDTRSEE